MMNHDDHVVATKPTTDDYDCYENGENDDLDEYLSKEISQTEEALEKLKGRMQQQHEDDGHDILSAFGLKEDDDEDDQNQQSWPDHSQSTSIFERLQQLEKTTESLCFIEDVLRWLNTTTSVKGSDADGLILLQSQQCMLLATDVLLKYGPEYTLTIYSELYTDAYLPLYEYVHTFCVGLLETKLQSCRYPHLAGCESILRNRSSSNNKLSLELSRLCQMTHELEETHRRVVDTFEGGYHEQQHKDDSVLMTFFQPILDRVSHHFANDGSTGGSIEDDDHGDGNEARRLMSSRTERIPEWLLQYIQKYVLCGSDSSSGNLAKDPCPYQVVVTLTQGRLAVPFLQEIVDMIKWVLVDKRRYFQHPSVVGTNSNPEALLSTLQHLLEFDQLMKDLIFSPSTSNGLLSSSPSTSSSFMGLMDVIVLPNTELAGWWMEREREFVFRTLFEDFSSHDKYGGNDDDNEQKNSSIEIITSRSSANHVSRRAEIFCALIRSVRFKASLLSSPGLYLRNVAVPLCSQFVDALRETSIDLRNLLIQQQRTATRSLSSSPSFTETQIRSNIHTWIELTNGCHLAALVLDTTTTIPTSMAAAMQSSLSVPASQSDHDLARFGRSLQTLSSVLIEEFTKIFVDTVLMEQTKFASFLMTASHLLASQEWEDDTFDDMTADQLSVGLKDTSAVLNIFLNVCESIIGQERRLSDGSKIGDGPDEPGIASFAPILMRSQVLNMVAEKVLEVALDTSNMIPEIWNTGATIFARDVTNLLPNCAKTTRDLPFVYRLTEVMKLMTMDFSTFRSMFVALEGLVGTDSGSLDVDDFTNDELVYQEAMNMLKAKGIDCPIEDAISIFNRRQS